MAIKLKERLKLGKNGGTAARIGLPTEPVTSTTKPESLVWVAIAPPGWGKTELFGSFPDSILLACEEGHKFVPGYKIVIDCYDYKTKMESKPPWKDKIGNVHMSFIQAIEHLETSDRFKFVTVDTVDALVKMITDFHSDKKKVEHIEDIGAYGRGYDLGQNSPFRRSMNRLLKSGRGIGYTTHQQVNTFTFKKGSRSKKETSLPSGIFKLLLPQVDIAIHGEFGEKRGKNRFRDRIVVTEGSEEILAKNRGGKMPTRFILPFPFEERWKTIKMFFETPATIKKAEDEYYKIYD